MISHTLTLRSDSIWEQTRVRKDGKSAPVQKGYWRLSGDTLWRYLADAGTPMKVTLQDRRLALSTYTTIWKTAVTREIVWIVDELYQRTDSAKHP